MSLNVNSSFAEEDFLDPAEAFQFSAAMHDPVNLDLHYKIAPDYYMYQERFELKITDKEDKLLFLRKSTLFPYDESIAPEWHSSAVIPEGEITYDPTFEQDMEVFHNQVSLRIPLQPGANGPLEVTITGQGCADSGLCYPPMSESLQLVATDAGYKAVGNNVVDAVPGPGLNENDSNTAGSAPNASNSSSDVFTTGQISSLDQNKTSKNEGQAKNNDNAQVKSESQPQNQEQGLSSTNSTASTGILSMGDTGMAAWLHDAALWQILALSLVFGALLSLTPCVLPMVPILVAIIAGQAETVSRFKGFMLAAVYVLGMSIVYTALGVAAGLMGAGLAAWLQSPWVLGSFAILLALFALAMLDVFTLQTPSGMQSSLQSLMQKMPGGQIGSVFIMGMLSALIVGPCVAAPLAGILLFISQTGDVVVGGSSLFAMAWGEGLLLLVVGAGAGAIIPRAGAWMNTLKYGFGILLLATSWWMARPLINSSIYITGWVVLGVWLGLLLWYATRKSLQSGISIGAVFLRSIAVLILTWALAMLFGLAAGGNSMLTPLKPFIEAGNGSAVATGVKQDPEAIRKRFTIVKDIADLDQQLKNTTRPVMLDFYADWCVSCLEMEKFTFSDAIVSSQMEQMNLLQADVTKMTDADRELLSRFDLFGPPGIIFFDRQGQLLADSRVVGFKKASEFSAVLQAVLD